MRSLATKQPINDVVKQQHGGKGRGRSISPLSTVMPILQRQCACGGGCPRCQDELGMQTKLKISEPGDKYEQQADRIADEVMRMPEPSLQRQVEPEEEEEEEMLQRKTGDRVSSVDSNQESSEVSPIVDEVLNSPGQPLDPETRTFMESSFEQDFTQVRVHTDDKAARSAQVVNALAYTVGQNIVFGSGQYAPKMASGKRLLAHELTHVVQQKQSLSPIIQTFRITNAVDVPSLTMEEWSTHRVPSKWNQLRNKLGQRDRVITQRLTLVSAGTPQHTTLTNLQARWSSMRSLLSSATFNPATDSLPSRTAINSALTDERADRAALTETANRVVRNSIQEFIDALNAYLRDRDTFDAEDTAYHRFDSLFTDPDVRTLLAGISHGRFTTADVKALVDQETGDLTNTAIHGISSSKPGITTRRPNRHGFIGLGQHSTSARDEAITWAGSQGVTIPPRPDPRTVPAQSIKLTAAFIGRVMDMLWPGLPPTKPTGDELKKLVFASYNGGHSNVIRAANSFLRSGSTTYDWDDIKNQPSISGQMRNYVAEIVDRLS
jgi:Domain of unknown function (DUF4157)